MSDFKAQWRRLMVGVSPLVVAALAPSPAFAQASASPVAETPVQSMQTAVEPETTAQTALTDNETGLGDIVVTARKVEENLQDVPVAVTAFSGADLANQNIQRVQDLGSFTPGLAIRPGSSTSSAVTISLRGQVQTDILATLDPSVGTYVDGVYWARAYGLNGSFLDVQSVQVLKGPQGTLFGRNTTGGALLFNSNDPALGEFSGRVSATYGRFDEKELVGVINIPFGERVALRIAATGFERDGYTRNASPNGYGTVLTNRALLGYGPGVTSSTPTARIPGSPNTRLDDRFRRNARAKLLFEATDNLSLLFSAEYFKVDESPSVVFQRAFPSVSNPAGPNNPGRVFTFPDVSSPAATFAGACTTSPAACFPPTATSTATGLTVLNNEAAFLDANLRNSTNNEVSYNYAKTQTYNFTGTLDTFFGAIKLVTGYRKIEAYSGIDLEGSSFPIHFTEGQQDLEQVSGELQITGQAFDDSVDFAGGVFAFHEDGSDQSISVTIPSLNPQTSHFFGMIDNDSMGAYGQATWNISDQFAFTGGVRYSVDDKGLEARNNNYNRITGVTTCSVAGGTFANPAQEIVGPAQCAFKRRDAFSGWSYTAGVDYKPTEDILFYLKTSKGFRSGGQNLRAPTTVSFQPFKPEIAFNYEVGFKGEFLDRRLRINLAAYQTDVKDIQRTTLISTGGGLTATILGNAGKARIRGAEAEVTALLFDGFRVTATGALVDPEYREFTAVDPVSGIAFDRSTERFDAVAKKQFSVAADYDRDLTQDLRIRLHADYAWRGKVATNPYNYPTLSNGTANPVNPLVLDATTAPSLGLLGARATLEYGDSFELSVFGRNLTNERKALAAQAVLPLGYANSTRQEPRTYGVTGTFKF
jgi:iron complex outermembrane receptor protein